MPKLVTPAISNAILAKVPKILTAKYARVIEFLIFLLPYVTVLLILLTILMYKSGIVEPALTCFLKQFPLLKIG